MGSHLSCSSIRSWGRPLVRVETRVGLTNSPISFSVTNNGSGPAAYRVAAVESRLLRGPLGDGEARGTKKIFCSKTHFLGAWRKKPSRKDACPRSLPSVLVQSAAWPSPVCVCCCFPAASPDRPAACGTGLGDSPRILDVGHSTQKVPEARSSTSN